MRMERQLEGMPALVLNDADLIRAALGEGMAGEPRVVVSVVA